MKSIYGKRKNHRMPQYNPTSDEMEWRNIDTSFVVGFNGLEVPTVNCCSYSNQSGEVRTMLAPVQTMIGDTMSIWVSYYDNWNTNASLVSKNFNIHKGIEL